MIKIGLVSDLHTEFWRTSDHQIIDLMHRRLGDADLLLLAGDIGIGVNSVRCARILFPDQPIFLVAGNHEFYNGDYDAVLDMLQNAAGENLRFLHKTVSTITIDNNALRIIGTTLWTDFDLLGTVDLSLMDAKRINDYTLIRYKGRALQPRDTLQWHEDERQWLFDALDTEFDGLTVVLTHHAPVSFATGPKFVSDSLSPCFASRLEERLIRHDVALVVWGHTHHCVDRTIERTRFVSNQTGYPGWACNTSMATETGEYGQIVELATRVRLSTNSS